MNLFIPIFMTLFLACSDDKEEIAYMNDPIIEEDTVPVDSGSSSPDTPIDPPKPSTPNPQPGNTNASTYLALGDSYTIGESVAENERWSAQLVEMLKSSGIAIDQPDIIARTGWTTSELASAIKANQNEKRYSIVSLLIGVNNQYRGQSIEVYEKEVSDLLNTATLFANGQPSSVFVLSIPDWGVTPFAEQHNHQKIAQEIDSFNAVAKRQCDTKGILFIDVTEISRMAKATPSYVASDGLHFSGSMYKLWAEKALPEVKKIL